MTTTPQTPKNGCLIVGGTLLLLFIAISGLVASISSYQEQNLTPEQKAQKEKEKVDDWYKNVSPISCENDLKDKLRDPSSYERDGDFTETADKGNTKIVSWKFRAKNGFGGYNIGAGLCSVSKENGGTIKTEVVSQ